jgi:hypothetical protein
VKVCGAGVEGRGALFTLVGGEDLRDRGFLTGGVVGAGTGVGKVGVVTVVGPGAVVAGGSSARLPLAPCRPLATPMARIRRKTGRRDHRPFDERVTGRKPLNSRPDNEARL